MTQKYEVKVNGACVGVYRASSGTEANALMLLDAGLDKRILTAIAGLQRADLARLGADLVKVEISNAQ